VYKRDKFVAEGEEGPLVKVLAVLGIFVVLCIAGAIGFVYFGKTKELATLDPDTFCPKSGPTSVTSVLIDRTDGINQVQAEALKTFIINWAHQVPEHGAFRVYEVAGGQGLPAPVLSVCNPGNVENVSVFTGNERMTRERYEAKFMRPVEGLIAGMLTDKESGTSPIMEAVQAMGVREFAPVKGGSLQLIIVSDLMQHTPQFSLYKAVPDMSSFRKSAYGQKIDSDLHGVATRIFLLHSTSPKQTGDVVQFWLDWLMLQGADIQGQFKTYKSDYKAMAGIWGNGETALPGDPPGELKVVEGVPDGGKIPELNGLASAFTPEEMFEIARKLYAASR
jgi:hypothetical protein